MITGDRFGLLNVFHYPNPQIDKARSYSAHSEFTLRVAFSKDGKNVFSIGG